MCIRDSINAEYMGFSFNIKSKKKDPFKVFNLAKSVYIKMAIKKFIQLGRVVYVNYGPDKGKYGVIVNIVNLNRVQIDGDDVKRQIIPIKRLVLTKLLMKDVFVGQRTGLLKKKIQKFDLKKKLSELQIYKAQQLKLKRAKLTDFDRFKVMVLKRRLSRGVRTEVKKIHKKEREERAKRPKKELKKKEAKKKVAPKKEAPKKDAPKKEAPKKEAPKKEAPKKK
eukprot:TRINITY_DN421_c0_g2_i1.p2 TRINITY_DN421_c0_g2~~TRINITY_DN421_c0_g2_i1.p2  ORF type:complete len:236 (-),score=63.69 TRINITY_DN421_c0_g2_i1:229-897(-)